MVETLRRHLRELIRKIYTLQKPEESWRLYFLMGISENGEIGIRGEDDVIVGDFIDSYQNLTLKTFVGHQFFDHYC